MILEGLIIFFRQIYELIFRDDTEDQEGEEKLEREEEDELNKNPDPEEHELHTDNTINVENN